MSGVSVTSERDAKNVSTGLTSSPAGTDNFSLLVSIVLSVVVKGFSLNFFGEAVLRFLDALDLEPIFDFISDFFFEGCFLAAANFLDVDASPLSFFMPI